MLVGVIGNTTDFDSVILGSSPKPVTNKTNNMVIGIIAAVLIIISILGVIDIYKQTKDE